MPKEREGVSEVIQILKQRVSRSEFFVASPDKPRDLCLKKAETCDVFIGIYKNSYGHIPPDDNPDQKSVIEMEYDAAYKKERPLLIFIHSNESKRKDELKQFLEKVTNFTYGRFRKAYKNIEDLKYQLVISLVFNIFNLERNLTTIEQRNLESLVEEVFRYKSYLKSQLGYVDFRGIPRVSSFISLEQSKLFVEPHIYHTSKTSNVNDITLDTSQSNEIQSISEVNKMNMIRANLSYPLLFVLKREYSYDMLKPNDQKINKDLEIKDIIEKYSRIVILGPPAIGKTTVLKNYILRMLEQNDLRIFPIFIRLIDYVKYIQKNNQSLEEYFDSFFATAGFSSHFINDQLRAGSCLIGFDGLDEVLDLSVRMLVAREIDEFVASYGRNNIIIVTSRVEGYRDSPLANGFEHFIIKKFDNSQISEFIDKWYKATEKEKLNDDNNNSQKLKTSLTKALLRDRQLFELARVPLLLKMICLINNHQVVLPKNKAELYILTLDTLLEYWEKSKGLDLEEFSVNVTISQIKNILKNLAQYFIEQKLQTLNRYQFVHFIKKELKTIGISESIIEDVLTEFSRSVTERSGLILELKPNEYGFVHESIKDFLFAIKISEKKVTEIFDFFKPMLHSERNREIITMVAIVLGNEDKERSNKFLEYILNSATQFEHSIHLDLILCVTCICEGAMIKEELKILVLDKLQTASACIDDYTRNSIHPLISAFLGVIDKKEAEDFLLKLSQISNSAVLSILSTYREDSSDFKSIISKCISEMFLNGDYANISFYLESRLDLNEGIAIDISKQLLIEFKKVRPEGNIYILNLITPLTIISESRDDLKNFLLSLFDKNNKLLTLTLAKHFIILDETYYKECKWKTITDFEIRKELDELESKINMTYSDLLKKIIDDMKVLSKIFPNLLYISTFIINYIIKELGVYLLKSLIKLGTSLMDQYPEASFHILQLLESYVIEGRISVVGPPSLLFDISENISPEQRIFLNILDLASAYDPRLKDMPEVKADFNPKLFEHINAIIRDEEVKFYFRRNALFLYARYHTDEELLQFVETLLDHPELCSSAATILIRNVRNIQIVTKKIINNKHISNGRKKELLFDLTITEYT